AGAALVPPLDPSAPASTTGPLARVGAAAQLEEINRQFDALDVALQVADPIQRIARVDQAAAGGPLGGVARVVLTNEIQAVSQQRLASIALALARWQRDKGKLPAGLAELP